MPKTVLIAEDTGSIRELMSATLERAGYQVITAEDGLVALNMVKKAQIDMVITDINMPNMNGIDLIKEIRSSGDNQFLPIIVCSTENTETKQKASAAGATGFIAKNAAKDGLANMVKRIVRE